MSKLVDKLLGKYETGKKQRTPGRRPISPPARLTAQKRASAEVREPAHTRSVCTDPPLRIVPSRRPSPPTRKDVPQITYDIREEIKSLTEDHICERIAPNDWIEKVFSQLVAKHPEIATKMLDEDTEIPLENVMLTKDEKATVKDIVTELGWSKESFEEILGWVKEAGEDHVSKTVPTDWSEQIFDHLDDRHTNCAEFLQLATRSKVEEEVVAALMENGWLKGFEFDTRIYDSYRDFTNCRLKKMALLFPEEFWEEAKAVGVEPSSPEKIERRVNPYSDVYAEVLELILEQAGAE